MTYKFQYQIRRSKGVEADPGSCSVGRWMCVLNWILTPFLKFLNTYDSSLLCGHHFIKYFYLSLIVHLIDTGWNSEQSLSSVPLGFSTRLQIEKWKSLFLYLNTFTVRKVLLLCFQRKKIISQVRKSTGEERTRTESVLIMFIAIE